MDNSVKVSQPQAPTADPTTPKNQVAVASSEELEQASLERKKRIKKSGAKYRRLLYITSVLLVLIMIGIYAIMPKIRPEVIEFDPNSLTIEEDVESYSSFVLPPPPSSQAVHIGVEGDPVIDVGVEGEPPALPKSQKITDHQDSDSQIKAATPEASEAVSEETKTAGLKSADQIAQAWSKSSGQVVQRRTSGGSQSITKVDAASAISFQNILFQLGSDELLDNGSRQQVSNIAEAMKRTTGVKFLVEGHTCDLGDASDNKSLSERRAARIIRELIRLGVVNERLEPLGFGAENPVVPNDSEGNRQKNRRVMIYKRA